MMNRPRKTLQRILILFFFAQCAWAKNTAESFIKETNPEKLRNYSHVYVRNSNGKLIYNYQQPQEFVNNKELGYQHRPSSTVRHISKTKDQLIYDATYNFNSEGHRVNLLVPTPNKKYFLILSGCSFIYGNGINDSDTLNNKFNSLPTDYHSYNWGIGASGPHMLLAKLLTLKNKENAHLPFNNGQLIYFYYDEHIRRTAGLKYTSIGLNKSPFYSFEEEKPRNIGSIGEIFKRKHILYKGINNLFKLLGLKYTFPKTNSEHIGYFCQVLKETQKAFKAIWPQSSFKIIQHSFSKNPPLELSNCLKKENLHITRVNFTTQKDDFIDMDGHPNRHYNFKMSSFLKEQLAHSE